MAAVDRFDIVMAPHTGDSDEMAKRANYLKAQDAWVQVQATFVVQGWLRPNGKLWDVCDNLIVKAPSLVPNADGRQILGVPSVHSTQDSEGGTLTTLECVLPNALSPYYADPAVETDRDGNITDGAGLGKAHPNPPDTGKTTS